MAKKKVEKTEVAAEETVLIGVVSKSGKMTVLKSSDLGEFQNGEVELSTGDITIPATLKSLGYAANDVFLVDADVQPLFDSDSTMKELTVSITL